MIGAVVFSFTAGGQTSSPPPVVETRASLIERAKRADSLHLDAESFRLHARLQDGISDVEPSPGSGLRGSIRERGFGLRVVRRGGTPEVVPGGGR